MRIRNLIFAALVASAMSPVAQAGIPAQTIQAFNEAVDSGDKTAIIETADALIAAALEHPGDPQAISAAFEAGTYLCLSNACPRASAASPLMNGANTEDVTPALANLLVVYADWSASQNKTTDKAMMSALEAVAPETPTYLTISAFDRYHLKKLEAKDINDIRKVAELGAGHLKPVWNIVPANWASLELSAIAATFARSRDTAVIDRLAKLEVALYPYNLKAYKDRPDLVELYYQTYAWRFATDSFFRSRSTRNAGMLKAADDYVEAETAKIFQAYDQTRERKGTPFCTGGLTKAPSPEYPGRAQSDGYVGAVILGFDIDEGKIANMRVLAAVPDRQFENAALAAMKRVEWYFDEVQKHPDCRRSRDSRPIIQSFQFLHGN